MGISYEPVAKSTYKATFWRATCYVKQVAPRVWVADPKQEELDDDLTSYKTRKAATRACLVPLMEKKTKLILRKTVKSFSVSETRRIFDLSQGGNTADLL